jgi:hypothetical protein
MSRGPGKIENAVVTSMLRLVRPTASQLAAVVYEVPEERLSPSQLGSVRRALRRLAERGIVTGETPPAAIVWQLVERHGPASTTAPPQEDAVVHLPIAGSTGTLGLRRVPVGRRRGRAGAEQ